MYFPFLTNLPLNVTEFFFYFKLRVVFFNPLRYQLYFHSYNVTEIFFVYFYFTRTEDYKTSKISYVK